MSEPHNPEHTPEGEEHGFRPSVPDLRPNLGEYMTIGTGNPDQGLATHFEDNEIGREATQDRRSYEVGAEYEAKQRELASTEVEVNKEGYNDAKIAVEELRLALEDLEATDPDNLMDRAALTEARKILLQRKEKWLDQHHAAVERSSNIGTPAEAVAFNAGVHFRNNEEAYKNQAVNDYRHAQRASPERYPEDLNYPGYTDRPPAAPPAPIQSEGISLSPNLEGNSLGGEAQELHDRFVQGDESAKPEAEQHYRVNEEAYRNQAAMDADRAGVDIDTDRIKTTSSDNSKTVEIRGDVSGDVNGGVFRI